MFKPYHQRFLKIKIKSLAEESRIIRREEKRAEEALINALHYHRVWDVRRESRASLLAYGYLRGQDISQVENKAQRDYLIDKRAMSIVKKFGTAPAAKGFEDWLQVKV